MKNIISFLDEKGIILLAFISFQPISDFIKTNINDQAFSLPRALSYYFIIILIYCFCVILFKLSFKNIKILYFSFLYALFVIFTFNYYLVKHLPFHAGNGKIYFMLFIFTYLLMLYLLSRMIINYKARLITYSILATFFAFDSSATIPNYYNYLNYKPSINFEMPDKIEHRQTTRIDLPNVYLLIPDAFPPERSISNIYAKSFEYKHTNELRNYGFQILNNAKANAFVSYSSIPHFFSMDYFFEKNGPIKSSTHVEIQNIFRGFNPVVAEFRKRKYKYIRVDGEGHIAGCTGIEDICIQGKNTIFTNQDLVFLERSYISNILNRLSRQEQLSNFLTFLNINPNNSTSASSAYMHNRLDLQLTDSLIVNNTFEDILPKLSESPYFFHWWMPFPHTPIRFNRECNLIEQQNWPNSYESNYEEWSKSYSGQNICADKILLKYAKTIMKHDEKAIILIHSDHGMDHDAVKENTTKRIDLTSKSARNLLNTFAAYKLPEHCNHYLNNENNSPVNAFRIIFSCIDNKKPKLKEYKAFMMDEKYENVIKSFNNIGLQ